MRWTHIPGAAAALALASLACTDSVGPNGGSGSSVGRLIAGEQVACALASGGIVYCWGGNSSFWEYGAPVSAIAGGSAPATAPVPKLATLARGVGTHFCGLTAARDAVCWARNDFGQLGGGSVGAPGAGSASVTVVGGIHWASIAVGRLTTCALSETGVGYCWGSNQQGEVGVSTITIAAPSGAPSAVDGDLTFTAIATGWLHACGITTLGDAYCWGSNVSGQLGIGSADTVKYRSPVAVSGGLKFTQITLGSRYSCGLTPDGTAYCWGENATGQLGDNTITPRGVPTLVSGGLKFQQIVASSGFSAGTSVPSPVPLQGGVGHTCGIDTNQHVYCWGWNGNGQLGDGTTIDRLVPTAVSGGLTLSVIALGGAYTCGMRGDGVWCWGSNLNGQIGNGKFGGIVPTPQAVAAPFR